MRIRRLVVPLAVASIVMIGVVGGAVLPASAHDSYEVGPGDTLSHIAVRTGTTVALLSKENGITNPDRLRVGQILQIPEPGHTPSVASTKPVAAPASEAAGRYVVQRGDTVSQIAVRFGVRRNDLLALNEISNPNRIYVGQKLDIPAGAIVPSAGVGGRYPDILDRISTNPGKLALVPIFEKWATANGIPVDYLMAVAWHESGWNNEAISSKGARGIGQIMPATGAWVAADLIGDSTLDASVPEDNIRMSARYLRWLINYLGSEELALAGYYQGPGAVRADIWYDSTELYVASVQAHRKFFLPS